MHSFFLIVLFLPGNLGLDLLLPNLTFLLEGVESRNCLEVSRGSLEDDASIEMWNCSEGFDTRLQWQFKDIKSSAEDSTEETFIISARISNVKSGKCLAVRLQSVEDASPIVQVQCDSSDDQLWLLKVRDPQKYPDTYELVSHTSKKCLDVFGGGKHNGASLIIFICGESGHENQLWNIITKIPQKLEEKNNSYAEELSVSIGFLLGIGLICMGLSAINTIVLFFFIWNGKLTSKDDGDYYSMNWDRIKDSTESERTL